MIALTIEGTTLYFQINPGDTTSGDTVKTVTTLKELFEAAVSAGSINTPAIMTQAVTLSLASFTTWLQNNGVTVPQGVADLVNTTKDISIIHAEAACTGEFSFSFSVAFDPALASGLTNGVFQVDNVGLSISHT